uniref:NADH-ubiquinone oxidoreductase chain 4 n=1 Tax=Eupteryx gracilirama TaxID=2879584 RepID=A0A8K1I2Q8_9HEMI|nr:NADH dehydrogenase subunit 4 [Eupteryx gracilirama]
MMKLFGFMLMLLPLFYTSMTWNLFQISILTLMIFFMMFNKYTFYCWVSYNFGIDLYSFGLIILSMLIISLMIISSNSVKGFFLENYFLFMNLMLCLNLILVFCTLNMLIMYLFFEFSLIFLLILIYTWGYQPERLISGLYLFFYTIFSSLPFFLVIIYLLVNEMTMYFDMKFNIPYSFMFFMFMFMVFLVKLPMFMVHYWLPKAHVQAPVSGSMILAGLLLKIGGYGFIRFMGLYEFSFLKYNYILYSLGIVGCILVSFVCLIQSDVKCLIAYSSIAHMGMCLLGICSMTKWGIMGSYFMMISHGLCSSGLFCLANFCYERYLSRSFFLNKGLINLMPSVSFFWFVFCCFNMSCPPSLNFFSEVLIINSMMLYWPNSFLYFFSISFFSACFSYFLYSYLQHGMPYQFYCYSLGFIREYLLMTIHLVPLVIMMLCLNFFI